jgi:hypothetical protein
MYKIESFKEFLTESNLKKNYKFTNHALQRWSERFSKYNIEYEIANSFPFGGQYGNDLMLLSPCEAVFVVNKNTVVTILTKEQAVSNIQTFLPGGRSIRFTN